MPTMVEKLTFVYNKETHAVVLLNDCYGGFSISIPGWNRTPCQVDNIPLLEAIECVGSLEACAGHCADLICVLVPREALPYLDIDEYDGWEHININRDHCFREMMEAAVKFKPIDSTMMEDMKLAVEKLQVSFGTAHTVISEGIKMTQIIFTSDNAV